MKTLYIIENGIWPSAKQGSTTLYVRLDFIYQIEYDFEGNM